jgi:ATP-dependent Clp protease ATP-binding subunit ClpA
VDVSNTIFILTTNAVDRTILKYATPESGLLSTRGLSLNATQTKLSKLMGELRSQLKGQFKVCIQVILVTVCTACALHP